MARIPFDSPGSECAWERFGVGLARQCSSHISVVTFEL